MDAAVTQRIMRLVGLGVRGRGAVVGVERVRDAARRGRLELVLVAGDASKHSLAKVVPLLEARRVRLVKVRSSSELGSAVGRDQAVAVGIVDRQLARGIRELVDSAPPSGGRAPGGVGFE